jgi:histone-lysine N-methyltransferase SETD3
MVISVLQTEVSYDYPRDAFLVSAGAAYVPGQQVFISYGAQNNDSLMQVRLCIRQDSSDSAYFRCPSSPSLPRSGIIVCA